MCQMFNFPTNHWENHYNNVFVCLTVCLRVHVCAHRDAPLLHLHATACLPAACFD